MMTKEESRQALREIKFHLTGILDCITILLRTKIEKKLTTEADAAGNPAYGIANQVIRVLEELSEETSNQLRKLK